ncbi:hypothetical protein Nepgr_030888 [Nepenthes gracilis]|uniref:Uncharacterized protein n=1 Tax=Nepenthes gracilis TaxID=150966 RepID=A0AAD3TFE8_NEPGR|nr:hypothetical protein Nepgr_030888 [Nepenthes gracilis]
MKAIGRKSKTPTASTTKTQVVNNIGILHHIPQQGHPAKANQYPRSEPRQWPKGIHPRFPPIQPSPPRSSRGPLGVFTDDDPLTRFGIGMPRPRLDAPCSALDFYFRPSLYSGFGVGFAISLGRSWSLLFFVWTSRNSAVLVFAALIAAGLHISFRGFDLEANFEQWSKAADAWVGCRVLEMGWFLSANVDAGLVLDPVG